VFLLASRVNPEVFDRLKEHKVMLWHSFGSLDEAQAYKGHPSIGGGSTSGMRAITVGYILGYRKFVLYGMDSCLAEDRLTKRFSGEQAGQVIDVIVGDRTFYCNGAMAQQANEFQELFATFPDMQIEAKGDGLIAAILEARGRLSFEHWAKSQAAAPSDFSLSDGGCSAPGAMDAPYVYWSGTTESLYRDWLARKKL
jgi:hypothetical protein